MSNKFRYNLILVFVICLLCVLCCGSALADEAEVADYPEAPVYVDGMLSCRGYVVDGDVYVSLESVCGVLGYETNVSYNEDKDTLTFEAAGIEIAAGVYDNVLIANGRCLYLPNGYFEVNGSAVFPVNVVAKIFSLSVSSGDDGGIDFGTANEAVLVSGDEYYNEDDLYWMSRIITWESGNQPVDGQIAVGNVVLNRVASDRFPDTLQGVIFQPGQFSPAMNGVIYGEPYEISVVCAKLVLEGYTTVGSDVLFFQVGRYGAVADMAEYVCTIGGHNFFK